MGSSLSMILLNALFFGFLVFLPFGIVGGGMWLLGKALIALGRKMDEQSADRATSTTRRA